MIQIIYSILKHLINIAEGVVEKYKNLVKIIGSIILILFIIIFGQHFTLRDDKPSKVVEEESDLEKLWIVDNIGGMYTAIIENAFGAKEPIMMCIEKNYDQNTNYNIKCIFAGYKNMKLVFGYFNPTEMKIDIPGYGIGMAKVNRYNKIVLSFIFNGKEVQFEKN